MANRYTLPLTYSFALHSVMGIVLVMSVDFSSHDEPQPQKESAPVIQAVTVNEQALEQQVQRLQAQRDAQRQAEEQRVADLERRAADARKASEQENQRIADLERARKQKEREKKAADDAARKAQQKQKAEQDRAAKAERDRKAKEQERKREEQAAAEAKAKREAEEAAAKQRAEEKARKEREAKERAAQEKLMAEQLAAEQAARNRARSQQVMGEVDKYSALIKQAIKSAWLIDDSMRGKSCALTVTLASNGFVTNVSNEQGDRHVCDAARNAIYKVQTLPVSPDPAVFEQLKSIRLRMEPEL